MVIQGLAARQKTQRRMTGLAPNHDAPGRSNLWQTLVEPVVKEGNLLRQGLWCPQLNQRTAVREIDQPARNRLASVVECDEPTVADGVPRMSTPLGPHSLMAGFGYRHRDLTGLPAG